MKKTVVMSLLFLGLGSAPAFAQPYVSCSAGIGIPGDWVEQGWGTEKLDSGLVLNGALGYNYGSARLEAAVGYQQHDWKYSLDDGSFLTVMANGYYDIETSSGITPYVMAGAGILNTDVSWSSDTDTSFAWQVGAGLGFKIDENLTFDVGYRYLRPEGLQSPGNGNDVDWETHNILAGIRYDF